MKEIIVDNKNNATKEYLDNIFKNSFEKNEKNFHSGITKDLEEVKKK